MQGEYKKQLNAAKQIMGDLKIVFASYLVKMMNNPSLKKEIMKRLIQILNQALQISQALIENEDLEKIANTENPETIQAIIRQLEGEGKIELAQELQQMIEKEKENYVLSSPADEKKETIKDSFKRFLQ